MSTQDYILGSHDTEIARLKLQHSVWRPRMLDAWRRAGITAGQTVIDYGCGPGYASIDLSEIVGPQGHVLAIDRSKRFLEKLKQDAASRSLSNIETKETDVTAADFNGLNADALWCRWVFSWLVNPAPAVEAIRFGLRPGGIAVFHEYLNYATWALAPEHPAFKRFVTAVIESTAATGANINSADFLPSMLEANGFELIALNPIVDVITPQNYVWKWPAAFMREYAHTLVKSGHISEKQADDALKALSEAENAASIRMVTPMVLEIIARRT